jgi:hypothetical protein
MADGSSADTTRKPVAHSPHRFEEGMGGPELTAYRAHVDVDVAVDHDRFLADDLVEQLIPSEHPPGIRRQKTE